MSNAKQVLAILIVTLITLTFSGCGQVGTTQQTAEVNLSNYAPIVDETPMIPLSEALESMRISFEGGCLVSAKQLKKDSKKHADWCNAVSIDFINAVIANMRGAK